eukprot:756059-Hanusia_phi.AAC.2
MKNLRMMETPRGNFLDALEMLEVHFAHWSRGWGSGTIRGVGWVEGVLAGDGGIEQEQRPEDARRKPAADPC